MLSKKGLLCFFPNWFFYVICNLACLGAWGWLFLWELKTFKFSVFCFWIFYFIFYQMENSNKEQFYFRCRMDVYCFLQYLWTLIFHFLRTDYADYSCRVWPNVWFPTLVLGEIFLSFALILKCLQIPFDFDFFHSSYSSSFSVSKQKST